MIEIKNLKLNIIEESEDEYGILAKKISRILKNGQISDFKIIRKSLDCRRHDQIHYLYTVGLNYSNEKEKALVNRVNNKNVMLTNKNKYEFPFKSTGKTDGCSRPVVVGAGPAGYLAALMLAKAGFCPIVIERGKDVEKRTKDVETFWNYGKLNPESNVSFGEGGAGTFSDGKLFTGNKDKYGIFAEILHIFHEMGADKSVEYLSKPHIGTDVLKDVMQNIRKTIICLGGEIHFSTCLIDISKAENKNYRLILKTPEGNKEILTRCVILAIGHSARDTFKMLINHNFNFEPKPFAIGLRIEHPQEVINEAMYGKEYSKLLPAADYKLTYHASNGRSVFSFCMCPGGYVVNASSDPESLVVNGMSYHDRGSENSNSAIVVNVTPDDFPGNTAEDAINFQKELEKKFYYAGAGKIPLQKLIDFKNGVKTEELGKVKPEMKGQYVFSDISSCLPLYVRDAIVEAIYDFGRRLKGYDNPDTILSGVESRTSSPVKILRDENFMAQNFPGIIPSGEGAGYAGGITSAAQDGIRAAEMAAKYLLDI